VLKSQYLRAIKADQRRRKAVVLRIGKVREIIVRLWRTSWHSGPEQRGNPPPPPAPALPPCAPECAAPSQMPAEWTSGLPTPCSARILARGLAAWMREQPDLLGRAVTALSVGDEYRAEWRPGWPPLKDFLKELATVLPRQRLYRKGAPSCTVYHVTAAAHEAQHGRRAA
jgi:hypothetical protein